jgi:hypothetical protein
MIGFISTSVTSFINHAYCSTITDLHAFQSTIAHTLGFPVFTSCLMAADLSTKTITSNHYEVFSSSRFQSPWNLGIQLKLLLLLTPSAYSSLLQLMAACKRHLLSPINLWWKYVTWLLSTVVWRHCLHENVFTEPLPRNGLHTRIVLLLRLCIT